MEIISILIYGDSVNVNNTITCNDISDVST